MSTKPYEDDPILTAYALGELDADEASAVEAQLADDPEARAYVADVRRTAERLSAALHKEPSAATHPSEHSPAPATAAVSRRRGARWPVALAAAATLAAVGLTTWSLLPELNRARYASERTIALNTEVTGDGGFGGGGNHAPMEGDASPGKREAERAVAQLRGEAMQAVQDRNYDAALEIVDQILSIDKENAYAAGARPLIEDRVLLERNNRSDDGFRRERASSSAESQEKRTPASDVLRYPDDWPDMVPAEAGAAREPSKLADAQSGQGAAASDPATATPSQPSAAPQDAEEARAEREQTKSMAKAEGADTAGAQSQGQVPPFRQGATLVTGVEGTLATPAAPAAVPPGQAGAPLVDHDRLETKDVRPTIDMVGGTSLKWPVEFNTEQYDRVVDNKFKRTGEHPLSTFGVDVDTASYANVRRFLNNNQLPPPDAVRIEELVNYFDYSYAPPTSDSAQPFAARVAVAAAPWNPQHRLVRIGIKGREIAQAERPASNLVFLLDVSGSMDEPNKLPLVRRAMTMLAEQVRPQDRVAIVVYAGSSGLVLPSTGGERKELILTAINQLTPGGSTNGAEGIQLAYQVAQQAFIKGGVNRVILCTDGDFNVGVTDRGQLTRLIEEKAKSGVYLSILGFGMGNLKDATMEELSNKGEGNYGYVDTEHEARKLLVEQMAGTLQAIAKDVKIQVEFNPNEVGSYRLIGYENRILAKEDFNDDTKDAGDIGAGHEVTALYEVVPVEVQAQNVEAELGKLREMLKKYEELRTLAGPTPDGTPPFEAEMKLIRDRIEQLGKSIPAPPVDDLKYQAKPATTPAAATGELLTVKLRYKAPDAPKEQGTSALIEFPVADDVRPFEAADEDLRHAAAVAGFGMLLRNSPYKGSLTWQGLEEMTRGIENLRRGATAAEGARLLEFRELVKKASVLAGQAVPPPAR